MAFCTTWIRDEACMNHALVEPLHQPFQTLSHHRLWKFLQISWFYVPKGNLRHRLACVIQQELSFINCKLQQAACIKKKMHILTCGFDPVIIGYAVFFAQTNCKSQPHQGVNCTWRLFMSLSRGCLFSAQSLDLRHLPN